jgi:6-phosphogluconate dehydrogenase (decarboxylating)
VSTQLGMTGLGRMGANIVGRLFKKRGTAVCLQLLRITVRGWTRLRTDNEAGMFLQQEALYGSLSRSGRTIRVIRTLVSAIGRMVAEDDYVMAHGCYTRPDGTQSNCH